MADDGIVQLDTSDPGAIQLTAIDRNHHLIRQAKSNLGFVATQSAVDKAVETQLIAVQTDFPRIQLVKVIPQSLDFIFQTESLRRNEKYCAVDTARNIIVKFVEENSERVGKNTAKIANAQLAELLSLDQEKPIQRKRMAKSIFDLLQDGWLIVDSRTAHAIKPKLHTNAIRRIRVVEKRYRNKNVTFIFGLQELFGVELQAVADVWRTSLASGVAPTVNGGGSEDNCLLIQGFRSNDVVELLKQHFNVEGAQMLEVTKATNTRKKKR